MKVKVIVTLKNGVLDPQGKAIQQTLNGMTFDNVSEVRQGKYFDIEVNENKKINLSVPETHNSFVYLLKGDLKIGSQDHKKINDSTLVLLEKGSI